MVEADHLTKTFNLGTKRVVEAVRDATFGVKAGEIFGLLGPNGAGKTTLLRMLATIITPTGGRCVMAGFRTDEAPEQVRRHIGFLSGNTKLYRRLTARELLAYFGRLYGLAIEKIVERTQELAQLLDMGAFLDQRCASLSTGQEQKVSIARVMLHDPPILILDEPTVGLDIMTSRTIIEFILEAKSRGHCIIFSTHHMPEAELLCDRLGFIYGGTLLAQGSPQTLYEQTGTDNLKDAFLSLADEQTQRSP